MSTSEKPCCPPAGQPQKYTLWVKVVKQEFGAGCCGSKTSTDKGSVVFGPELSFEATPATKIKDSKKRFKTANFKVGMWVTITDTKSNNKVCKVTAVASDGADITVDGTLTAESGTRQATVTGVEEPECCNFGLDPNGDVCHHMELSWLCKDLTVPLENGETGEAVSAGNEKPRTNVWGNRDTGPRGTSFWRLWKKPNGKWQLFNVCHQLCHVDQSATLWPIPGQKAIICSATGAFKFKGNETATPNTIERPSGTFTTDGFAPKMSIKISGTPNNNVFRTIESIDDATHTMKVTHLLWTEDVTDATIMAGLTTTKFMSEETEWDGFSPKVFKMKNGYKDVVVARAKPVPDFCPPQRHWQAGHPDDLNDAPFWPTLDIPLMEDSDFAPVRYFNGELQLRVKDIGSNGFGVPWGHTRIYSNRLSFSADVGNGTNWLVHEWPYLKQESFDACCMPGPTIRALSDKSPIIPRPATGETIVLVRGTRNALWFDEYVHQKYPGATDTKASETVKSWEGRFGAKHRLIPKPSDKTILSVAPNGHQWVFNDFTCERSDTDPPPGSLKQHIGPGGQKTVMTYKDGRLDRVTRKCKAQGPSEQVVTETYSYEYIKKGDNKGRLESITLYRNDIDIPADKRASLTWQLAPDDKLTPTGPPPGKKIRRVEYLYYKRKEKGSAHGQCGDLKMVATQVFKNDKPRNLDVHYYRYYKTKLTDHCQGQLKYVIGPEAFRRLVKAQEGNENHTAPTIGKLDSELETIAKGPLVSLAGRFADAASESTLNSLAELKIEYDNDNRVKNVFMNGGKRKHSFIYRKDDTSESFNIWSTKTTETKADENQRVVFTNRIGQTVLSALGRSQKQYFDLTTHAIRDVPLELFFARWVEYFAYDPWQGHVLLHSKPSGVQAYLELEKLATDPISIYPHKQRSDYLVYTHSKGSGAGVQADSGYVGYIDEVGKSEELFKKIDPFLAQLMVQGTLSSSVVRIANIHVQLGSVLKLLFGPLVFLCKLSLFPGFSFAKEGDGMARHDLTDEQWELIADLFPLPARTGRPPTEPRVAMNAILWILRASAAWRDLPEEFPPWETIYGLYNSWNASGLWDKILVSVPRTASSFFRRGASRFDHRQPRQEDTRWPTRFETPSGKHSGGTCSPNIAAAASPSGRSAATSASASRHSMPGDG